MAEEALAMLRDDRAPVTHWKPLLRVRYVVDHASYPLGKCPLTYADASIQASGRSRITCGTLVYTYADVC